VVGTVAVGDAEARVGAGVGDVDDEGLADRGVLTPVGLVTGSSPLQAAVARASTVARSTDRGLGIAAASTLRADARWRRAVCSMIVRQTARREP
jgi:hypothetical protein